MPEQNSAGDWLTVFVEMTKEGLERSFRYNRQYGLAKDQYTATSHDNYLALARTVRDRLIERWISTQQRYHKKNPRRVYYLSLEFLIGRLLGNNIINLGLGEETEAAMKALGCELSAIREEETDAGLGNGGLGRLAACFLDSMATLGLPAYGYGIRYDYGIFNQKIINGAQVEQPEEWLRLGNPWEISRPEYSVKVKFYGKTYTYHDKAGRMHVKWVDTDEVLAMPYDIPVPGFRNDVVNTLRLWSARSTEEFNLEYFNHGDYERAVQDKMFSENISRILYPNENFFRGKELRLKQEYFFTAASISDIIRRFKVDNQDIRDLSDKTAIQLNDTHPALAVCELMRVLLDEEGLDWDAAWNIIVKTFAYTNHTVMPEALEVWPLPLFAALLPRHLEIIYEINFRFLREVASRYPGDNARLQRMSLIEESNPKQVRMSHLSLVGSHSVNGVSALHSQLLKTELFRDFYELWPEKFNCKTNGITQRRWLYKANDRLSRLITEAIGDRWITDLYELEKLMPLAGDAGFRRKWDAVKAANKKDLAEYVLRTTGIRLPHDAIFDVQVKRIHEYKRQLLFALYILHEYLRLKKDPKADFYPRAFIFGGKAAPGYFTAKLIIRFINSMASVINADSSIKDRIKVVFLENYRVSLAEKIFPAADLSEQISTAGTEASGTGCMKFMVNGALTIGTLDGANIEIAEAVGKDNMFIFGATSDKIAELRQRGYRPQDYIRKSAGLAAMLDLIKSNFFSPIETDAFLPLARTISEDDPFFICADFEAYCAAQAKAAKLYRDRDAWLEKSIINTAKSGRFSSDRTIREYAEEIWKVPVKE